MTEFISFFVILIAAVLFSALFNRLHLPWVVALVTAGMVIGPTGFGWIEPGAAVLFLGEVGLVFLMFTAGLETRFSAITKYGRGIAVLALINGVVPALVGFSIAWLFGYQLSSALLLGIIFISTSIAVVVPSMETNGLLHTRVGITAVGATILEDIISLMLLSLVLQTQSPSAALPLYLYYPLLIGVVVLMRLVVPKIRRLLTYGRRGKDLFQNELRLVVALLIGLVAIFELLGLHIIIAGFLAGLVLSESIKSPLLKAKLRTVSYGLFIPIFFVLVGAKTDLSLFKSAGPALWLVLAIIAGSLLAKFLSGWVAARLVRFSSSESVLLGAATMPSLSTTLAVAFTGLESGLLDETIVTALVLLSLLSVLIGPLVVNRLAKTIPKTSIV